MSWLHIAKIPGIDGRGYWLVVPGISALTFSWAISHAPAPEPIRKLPLFQGWLVPVASENAMWQAISATHGPDIVCMQCLHGEPCESWLRLVLGRFEEAKQNTLAIAPAYDGWRAPGYEPVVESSRKPRQAKARKAQPRYTQPKPPPSPSPPAPSREDLLRGAARILGISWPASKDEVNKAFRRAALRLHPDLGGSDRAMREAIEARSTLLATYS